MIFLVGDNIFYLQLHLWFYIGRFPFDVPQALEPMLFLF